MLNAVSEKNFTVSFIIIFGTLSFPTTREATVQNNNGALKVDHSKRQNDVKMSIKCSLFHQNTSENISSQLTAVDENRPTHDQYKQEVQLSLKDRAMRRVNWNLANCHATVQKLLIRQVLTESMVWSWRFSPRQCVTDNVHSTMTRPRRLPLSQVS